MIHVASITAALGVTLLHTLWQGTALAFVLRLSEPALATASPNQRARVYGGALAALPAASLLTLCIVTTGSGGAAEASSVASLPLSLPLLGGVWIVGAAGMLLRSAMQWRAASGLRRRAEALIGETNDLLVRLAAEMGVMCPPLRVSAEIACPMLVGILRPALLLPVGFLTGLTPRQAELIIRHELAHLVRLDPILNAVQGVVDAVYFFHPAAWWISARVREAREVACDDLAVRSQSDRMILARALVVMETNRQPETFALAATGGPLMKRIQYLVRPARPPFRATSLVAPCLAIALFTLAVLAACGGEPQSPYDQRATPFVDAIERASARHEVPAELITAVMAVESNFDPKAESTVGARGLMQLMPDTAALVGVDDIWDPHENIDGGATYLRMMLDRYDGDVELATAAYNAGPEAVDRAGGVPDNGETPRYVRAVLDRYQPD